MMHGGVPKAVLSPDAVVDEEPFWLFRRSIEPYFESFPLLDPADPANRPCATQFHLGSFLFYGTQFARQRSLHDTDWAARHDDADHLLIQVFLKGAHEVVNGGHAFRQEVGNVSAVNLGRVMEGVSTDAHVHSLVLPRDWISGHIRGIGDASGVLFARDGAAARIFSNFVGGLRNALEHAKSEDLPLLTDSLLGLLGPLLKHSDLGADSANAGVLLAICRHIEDNLTEPTLDGDAIAARFNCSRSTLYRIFREHGGIQVYIQRRRLIACFKAITMQVQRQIYDIALDYGFGNASHFSAQFRKHFGMTPREVRALSHQRLRDGLPLTLIGPEGAINDADVMYQWGKSLNGRPPSPSL